MMAIKNRSLAALAESHGWESLSELELQVCGAGYAGGWVGGWGNAGVIVVVGRWVGAAHLWCGVRERRGGGGAVNHAWATGGGTTAVYTALQEFSVQLRYFWASTACMWIVLVVPQPAGHRSCDWASRVAQSRPFALLLACRLHPNEQVGSESSCACHSARYPAQR
jgi:hypothetical protein